MARQRGTKPQRPKRIGVAIKRYERKKKQMHFFVSREKRARGESAT